MAASSANTMRASVELEHLKDEQRAQEVIEHMQADTGPDRARAPAEQRQEDSDDNQQHQ